MSIITSAGSETSHAPARMVIQSPAVAARLRRTRTEPPAQKVNAAPRPIWARGPLSRAWLWFMFWSSCRTPRFFRLLKKLAVRLVPRCAPTVLPGATANLRRIVGPHVRNSQCRAHAERVVGRFCDFVLDIGQSTLQTPEELRARIDGVEGRETYVVRRKLGGGAIVVTAHMGSFEVGLAALAQVERTIHVVFKRDAFDGFEMIRKRLRDRAGIREAAIDDGWQAWAGLRDALRDDEVVVLQADRAMPGQKSAVVPFLHGHLRLPLGPVKLALASGAPIIPIFTVMTGRDRCQVFIEPPIEVSGADRMTDGTSPALLSIARSIEKFVQRYPDQWLVLTPAFVEDEK